MANQELDQMPLRRGEADLPGRGGDPARGLPACNSCHGFSAGGPIETPTLSHQNKEYLARQLRAFKDGSRRNDIYTRMRSVSQRLTDREIDKLAEFYATTISY